METKTLLDTSPLTLLSLEEAEKKLPASLQADISSEQSTQLENQAKELIDELLKLSVDDIKDQQAFSQRVENMGRATQEKLVHKSKLLREPMETLMNDLGDSGSVASSLVSLQETINEINPNRYNFNMNGFRRLLSKIPGVGTVMSKWLVKYQSVQSVINDIVDSLTLGRERLERDNITLNNDQVEMHALTQELNNYVEYGQIIDKQLSARLAAEQSNDTKVEFIQKDILFPLRQRVMDLQQQLAVNQHGVITAEALIQNNKELIRGVDRSLNVTVVAFQTASTLSIALEHQKKVLKGVQAVNDTTNELLLQTSEKLRKQGATIQQQAASTAIDTQVLKQAFENVDVALQEVNEFRIKALPQLSSSIDEMTEINRKMSDSVANLQASKDLVNALELKL